MNGNKWTMNNISLRNIFFNLLLFLLAYYLGFTFIAASLDKIVDPFEFSKSILNYEIMPYWTINLISIILPWVEFICGVFIIFCFFSSIKNTKNCSYFDASNNIIILMLLWFIFILAVAHIRGLDIDCGCGFGEKTLPLDRLKEDIYLLISAFIIKFRHKISNILLGSNF